MSKSLLTKYRMLTPLTRLRINSKEKVHFKINEKISIIINDNTVFQNFNNISDGKQTIPILTGSETISFNHNPLFLCMFNVKGNHQEHALKTINDFLTTLALFKTTNTKLKSGKKIIQTINSNSSLGILSIPGSDDTFDVKKVDLYTLSMEELEEFKLFYNKFVETTQNIKDKRIFYAIDFYSKASATDNITEKFIFLSLTLELLFSREDKELSYRFSNRIAHLIGNSFSERETLVKNVKLLYDKRSSLFHGASFKAPTLQYFYYMNELMRSSVLQYLSLYHTLKKDPISEINKFLLRQDEKDYSEFQEKRKQFGKISEFKYDKIKKIEEISI